MAAGRGIIGSIDGTSADIINRSNTGMVCNAGNDKELADIIIKMADADDDLISTLAGNSRNYFLNNFTINKYVDQILKKLEELG